jgi:hypothetical protein
MNAVSKKAQQTKGLSDVDLAGSCQFGMNSAGTCRTFDTPVTQPTKRGVHPAFRGAHQIREAIDIILIVGMASGAVCVFALVVALVAL